MVEQYDQHKMIVYNIPQHQAIDIIEGNAYRFIGDSSLLGEGFLQSFHLLPSRVMHGVIPKDSISNTCIRDHLITGAQRSVLVIDGPVNFTPVAQRIPVDIIILSGNPKIYLTQLATVFDCKQYIFDNSNPLWKIRYWKKDADSLHLRHHTISEQGAFEVDL